MPRVLSKRFGRAEGPSEHSVRALEGPRLQQEACTGRIGGKGRPVVVREERGVEWLWKQQEKCPIVPFPPACSSSDLNPTPSPFFCQCDFVFHGAFRNGCVTDLRPRQEEGWARGARRPLSRGPGRTRGPGVREQPKIELRLGFRPALWGGPGSPQVGQHGAVLQHDKLGS